MFYWLDSLPTMARVHLARVGRRYADLIRLIWNSCEELFVKKWRMTTVETGALSIV
jgi:hypothetical protein